MWEGVVLSALLTQDDIAQLLHGAFNYRQVVRLFTTRRLRGTKVGRKWVIRASRFIEDWDELERMDRISVIRKTAIRRRPRVVEVAE